MEMLEVFQWDREMLRRGERRTGAGRRVVLECRWNVETGDAEEFARLVVEQCAESMSAIRRALEDGGLVSSQHKI